MATVRVIDRYKKTGTLAGKRWEVFVDYYTETGDRIQRRQGFATEADARAYELEARAKLKTGRRVAPSELSIGQAFTEHLERRLGAQEIGANTYSVQRSTFDNTYGALSEAPIHTLPITVDERVLKAKVERIYAIETERGIKGSTLAYADMLLRGMFRHLVEDEELLAVSPMERITKPKATVAVITTWTRVQWDRFWAQETGGENEALWLLLTETSLRIGEVQALRWGQVDLEAGALRVAAGISRVFADEGKRSMREDVVPWAKTPQSLRVIEFGPRMAEVLKRYRRRAIEDGLALGRGFSDESFLFPAQLRRGEHISGTTVRKRLRTACKAAKVPELKPHELRHTGATIAIGAGVPIDVQMRRMGHANMKTLQRYLHPGEEERAQAAALIDAALHPRPQAGRSRKQKT
jgi:integrase